MYNLLYHRHSGKTASEAADPKLDTTMAEMGSIFTLIHVCSTHILTSFAHAFKDHLRPKLHKTTKLIAMDVQAPIHLSFSPPTLHKHSWSTQIKLYAVISKG